ncbi:ATP-binding protein [Loktanella agnita]
MLANIANALSVLLILWLEDQMRLDAVIWSMIVIGIASLFLMRQATRRRKPFPERLSPRTYRRSVMQAAFLGMLWAYPGLVILPDVDGPLQAFFIALASGMIAGGAITLYPLPTAAYTFCGMIIAGSFIGFSRANEPSFWAFALVATTFSIIIYQSIKRHERIFVSEFEARKILDGQNEHMGEMLETSRNDALEERKRSEERLLQAQKLEAIGQLTAGIAHDFNNLLTAIRGHAELLAMSDSAQHDLIDPIVQSSDRGAELVRRLLAFARQQALAPRPVYPREIINETTVLMRRTLREDIEVNVDIASDSWAILIDPNLLSNAILNLGTNARDAMPNGGVITISLTNAANEEVPSHLIGDFVRLCVRDTGAGMTKDTQQRAIEPFFTTKEFGTGSGLGLSMVYGFAIQSGGTMSIKSKPGAGTTITLLLPKSPISPQIESGDTPKNVPTGSGKRVLLVEDNPSVRGSVIRLLESLDYVVTATQSVETAIDVMMQTAEDPDIILSDIVLPGGQRGTDFIREIRRTHPKIAVVLMTGYANTEGAVEEDAVEGVLLLNKPFGRAELAVAMSEAFRER